MTTVKVTWHQAKEGGQCDFCPRATEGDCPYIDFAATTALPDGRKLTHTGPWGLCRGCTTALGLKPGDGTVDEAHARQLHARCIVEICVQQNMEPEVIQAMMNAMSWGPDPAPSTRTELDPGVYRRGDGMVEVDTREIAAYMELAVRDERVRARALKMLEIHWR